MWSVSDGVNGRAGERPRWSNAVDKLLGDDLRPNK